jgi:biopolymer transport protein ExbD
MKHRRTYLHLDPVMIVMSDVLFQIVVFALLASNAGARSVPLDDGVELPPGGKGAAALARRPQLTLTVKSAKELPFADLRVEILAGETPCRNYEELRRLVTEACGDGDDSYVELRCDGRVDLDSLCSLRNFLADEAKVKTVKYLVARGRKKQ